MIVAKRFRVIILRECRVRVLREMGVGWVRDGCDVPARVVMSGCETGDDGAVAARGAMRGVRADFLLSSRQRARGNGRFSPKTQLSAFYGLKPPFFTRFSMFFRSRSRQWSRNAVCRPLAPRHARCATPLREDLPRHDHTLVCMSQTKSDNISVSFARSHFLFLLCFRVRLLL